MTQQTVRAAIVLLPGFAALIRAAIPKPFTNKNGAPYGNQLAVRLGYVCFAAFSLFVFYGIRSEGILK